MNALRNYWHNLSSREQLLLGGGGLGAAAIIFYVAIWEPWHRDLERLRSRIPEQVRTYAWMSDQHRIIMPVLQRTKRSKPGEARPLLTVVEKTAEKMGLRGAIRRMQPGRGDDVQVWMDKVVFDRWLQWINALGNQGITVSDALISRDKESAASVRATFQRD